METSHSQRSNNMVYIYPDDMLNDDSSKDRYVTSQSGSEYVLEESEFVEYSQSGLDVRDYVRYTKIMNTANDCRRGLPNLPLSDAMVTAMKAKAYELTQALRIAEANQTDLAPDDIRRAMRDMFFVYSSLAVATGAHSTQEAIEKTLTYAYPEHVRHLSGGRYESSIHVRTETMFDEGDHEDVDDDERDYVFEDFVPYTGTLVINIDPSKRVEFSYTPEQASAQNFHVSETTLRSGNQKVFNNSDLSMRLDLDPTAPAGIALDVGRSAFDGDKLYRDGDLLGKAFSTISNHGSHEYSGFTPDMKNQFAQFADELALQQYLFNKWRADERNGRLSHRLSDAVVQRYFMNNPTDAVIDQSKDEVTAA